MEWWSNFSAGLVSTLVGAVVGIPLGLWVNRWTERRRQAEDFAKLIQAVTEAVDRNLVLVELVKDELPTNLACNKTVDVAPFDAIAVKANELLPVAIRSQVNAVRFDLYALNRNLDHLFHVGTNPSEAAVVSGQYYYLRNTAVEILKRVGDSLTKLKSELEVIG